MKLTIFAVLSIAVLLPRSSSATPRRVDNSDYGIQFPGTACASFSDSSGMDASCFFTNFSPAGDYGFLVGFDSTVSDVRVSFSNANILDTGLVICDDSDFSTACDRTPTWDFDGVANPTELSLLSSTVTSTSAIFDLNGTINATNVQGRQVAFLLLCAPSATSGPAPSDCGGVDITVRSLASTEPTPVPEPASLWLCGGGAAMLALRFRKRQTR